MIFQQRIRLIVEPQKTQDVPTSLVSLISRFFLDRAETYNTDRTYVHRMTYENATYDQFQTRVDMIIMLESPSLTLCDLYIKSLLRRDETFPFRLQHHDYIGL